MKKYLLSLLWWSLAVASQAQLGDILKRRAGEGVRQGAASGTEKAMDKGLDRLFHKNKTPSSDPKTHAGGQDPAPSAAPLNTYSRYDFIPGEKILGFDDFSQDAIGDFPGKWTTNASGEIVTVDQYTGHWLNITKEGYYMPQFIKGLSDNFTLEYDVLFIPPSSATGPNTPSTTLQVIYTPGGKPSFDSHVDRGCFELDPYMGNVYITDVTATGKELLTNSFNVKGLQRKRPFHYHVAVWRQKTRLRVYLDETKVVDAPSLLSPDIKYNGIRLSTSMSNDGSTWLIGNFKFASGLPDTRNKLLTEGKFSTTGILFDIGSPSIKPNSYGALKEIAALLKETPELHIRIIGHTDNDGDADANLELSRKRAVAVKTALVTEFAIEAGRIETDGKGSSQPAAPNTTPEGRAQNRRVEFVKLGADLGFIQKGEPIPATLTFDWQVIQRTGGEDGEQEVTYYFTTSGDYAALKPQDKSFSLMVYSRQGHTWMFDDKTKTIMVMNMPRVVGEGGLAAKKMAEHFKKGPLEKDKNDEPFSVRKTGRTREIAGYTADEYEMTNTRASSGRTGAASFWYAKVPFDPVKIYTMGAGRPADLDKLRNDPKMKDNITAIPVLNTNYLWVETEAGGKKGLQTLSIKKSPVTINTSGYTIKSLQR